MHLLISSPIAAAFFVSSSLIFGGSLAFFDCSVLHLVISSETAWAHFVSAARVARLQNRAEHAKEADRRRAELEPRLSTLTLRV